MANTTVSNIDRVIARARVKYDEVMQSEYVAKNMIIDGYVTKGQVEENKYKTDTKGEYSRKATCMLDVPTIHRGSSIDIQEKSGGEWQRGIVNTTPTWTPVDIYFDVLLFNTVVKRYRKQNIYSEDGYVIGDNPLIEDEIPCFVQRIGTRQRQVDVGIDRNAVNEIITSKQWDIKVNDILHIGSERYKVTDFRELDKDIFQGYITYYRE